METQTEAGLFEPTTLNGLDLKNRIVMAPMTRSRAIGGIPNDLMATYYAQRSSAGLIITEGTSPSPNGLGYARIPGIYTQDQIEGWKKVTHAVHREGSKIFLQLMHTGRIAHPDNLPENAEMVAPSQVSAEGSMWTDQSGMQPFPQPIPLSRKGIQIAVQEFVQAAKNAIQAGFDGVEIHGANGYLLEQFLNPHVNTRTDGYGGSIANRIRFVVEVTASIVDAIGKDKVGIRLSPYNRFNGMPLYEEVFETYERLVKELNGLGLLYIHLVESSARELEEGRHLMAILRGSFDNLWMVNGGYSKEKAESMLTSGQADLISFGSPFISNPDFPERIRNGSPLTPPDAATFYSSDQKGYTDYPLLN